MALTATLTGTTTISTEVQLKPSVRRKLIAELNSYQELKNQLTEIQKALDTHKVNIEGIRESVGEQSISISGFKVSLVSPVRSSLDKKALLEAGVSMAQLEAGTVTKPVKPYTKVSTPGEVERVYE